MAQDNKTGNTENTELVKESTRNGIAESLYGTASIIISAIMIIMFIFTFAFRIVGVQGHSMDDTLATDDWLIVTHFYSQPEYGDIVVSTKETAAQGSLIKRVIAVAGDVVDIDEDDNVYVNGEMLDEDDYTIKDGIARGDLTYPVTVPEGCVMLMGDNRVVSWDSRYSDIGFAETEYLLGKAQIRLSSDWNIYDNFDK